MRAGERAISRADLSNVLKEYHTMQYTNNMSFKHICYNINHRPYYYDLPRWNRSMATHRWEIDFMISEVHWDHCFMMFQNVFCFQLFISTTTRDMTDFYIQWNYVLTGLTRSSVLLNLISAQV